MRIAEPARDDVLLRRAAKGEEEAFTLLYRRYQAAMYRFALRMTGSAWPRKKCANVFMTLMRAPKKYDSSRGTLGGTVRNCAKPRDEASGAIAAGSFSGTKKRGRKRRGNCPAGCGDSGNLAEARERMKQVRAAVLNCAEFREAVVLCELEELSYEEAAASGRMSDRDDSIAAASRARAAAGEA